MDDKDIKTKEEPNSMIVNNFQTVYSLQNNGVQDQGPFISTTTVNNLYSILPYGINAELLVRNKSKNGSFTDNLQVDGQDIIEFKLSITNTSTTETLHEVQAQGDIINNLLLSLFHRAPTASMGSIQYSLYSFKLDNVKNLPPGGTVVATFELIALYSGKVSFYGYVSVRGDRYNLTMRRFNFSKLPSLSIINAPLYSNNSRLLIGKHQRLIQSNIQNDFIYTPLSVINGDIIEFEIVIKPTSDNIIKKSNPKDKLSNNLSYIPSSFSGKYVYQHSAGQFTTVNKIYGNVKFNLQNTTNINGKLVGGSIEWDVPTLIGSNIPSSQVPYIAILYFQCEVVG